MKYSKKLLENKNQPLFEDLIKQKPEINESFKLKDLVSYLEFDEIIIKALIAYSKDVDLYDRDIKPTIENNKISFNIISK